MMYDVVGRGAASGGWGGSGVGRAGRWRPNPQIPEFFFVFRVLFYNVLRRSSSTRVRRSYSP